VAEHKTCRDCGETKPVTEYYRAATPKDGLPRWQSYCKPCAVTRSSAWQKQNPERYAELQARHNPGVSERRAERATKKRIRKVPFEALAENLMRDAGLIPLTGFPGATTPWPCTCTTCGSEVTPRYCHVYVGQSGCNQCAGAGGFKPEGEGWMYAVTDGDIVKVGISNRPKKRLADHRSQGLDTVLHLVKFPTGTDAMLAESMWKAEAKARPHLRVTKDRLPDGHTEALLLTDETRGVATLVASLAS